MSAGRLSERADLRPMAMATPYLRQGMVVVTETIGAPAHKTVAALAAKGDRGQRVAIFCTDGDTLSVGSSEPVTVLGENVLTDELAPGDTVWTQGGHWHLMVGHWTGAPSAVVRAYVDPEWERAQAEDEAELWRCIEETDSGPAEEPAEWDG